MGWHFFQQCCCCCISAGSHDHRVLLLVLQTVHAVKAANPRILNLQKLSNRIKRDLLFVTRQQQLLQEQPGSSEQQDGLEQWGGLTESRLQGIINNLRGFHGELMALHEAPGVVAVCKKFTTEPPKVSRCTHQQLRRWLVTL
ncbi:hypothetical protein COO60DRAFT_831006 [Scenedesmus sp. NREL 46B-D3]|nr:hypothetical protein COO60DRAFT_831006 [Scenedesmus sp. NREL 46B-D3]